MKHPQFNFNYSLFSFYILGTSGILLIAVFTESPLLGLVFFKPYVIEIFTIIFFVTLGLWWHYSTTKKRFKIILPILLGSVVFLFISFSFSLMMFLDHVSATTLRIENAQTLFKEKEALYLPLVTTLFDKAETTNIRSDIDQQYNRDLGYQRENGEYEGRQPVYFIRLKGDRIQKLFQSGDIKNETVNTKGEKLIAKMLQGKKEPVLFPQYTCCGGNDIWNDIPFLRLVLPDRRYLKDFPSELEEIYLIHDTDGRIHGALVSLWGD